jgi:tetratricopeptide (TPR) repeat protein
MKRTTLMALLVGLTLPVLSWAQGDFQKGISYYKQGQYAKAVQEFEQLVKADPKYESGYRVLGDSYLKLRQFDKAAEAFKRAAELDSNNFSSFLGAAVAQFNQNRYQDAIDMLESGKAAAKAPKDRYQLFQLRGSSYYNLQKYAQAVADLEKAVSIQRGDYNDVFQLGLSYLELGDYAKARQYLGQAAALGDDQGKAQGYLDRVDYQQALAAIRRQQYPQAAQALKQFVQAHPDDADAWYNLGLAQLFTKKLDDARSSFEQCTKLSSSNADAFRRLGYIYEVQKHYEASLKSYQKAHEIKSDPSDQKSIKRVEERIRRQKQSAG